MVTTHPPTLTTNLSQRTFGRHDLLPLRPDGLWQIERGAVRSLTWSEQGTATTLGYWGVKDVVGQPLSSIQPYQIECLTPVTASYIPVQQWAQVLEAIFRHIHQVEELLCIVRQEGVYNRLLQLLIWLSRKFGHPIEQGQLIDLRITHQDIAEVLGTTRVTVTRLISRFEQEGIIYRFKRHFILVTK